MFNPAVAAQRIKNDYIGYLSTSFRFSDQTQQRRLLEELDKTVSNGPFVEIKDAFVTGKSIADLIDNGTLSPLFRKLESDKHANYARKLPVERPLYLHQEKAIEKIVAGENIVVSTGTGSGKTHCFIIPVLDTLLREQAAGTLCEGVRAIFVYPMNALANDQIKGLREILMAYPRITFGVYNGGTEHKEADAIKLYEAMYANEKYPELRKRLPNELLSREEMKKKPPHILFTNYAMLEHMLFRPGDDGIFSNSNFKYVILDEAHVYAGAKGIETALLMGRLKGRIRSEGTPQFILTSATLGGDMPESNARVVEFASRLTGCEFFQDAVITAYRDTARMSGACMTYPPHLYCELANDEKSLRDVLSLHSIAFSSTAKNEEILYDLIEKTDLYAAMRQLGSLITLDDFAQRLDVSGEVAVSFVALCAKAQKGGKPLVDIRYHFFLRALDGGYLALDYPQSFSLVRRDRYQDKAQMFEIAVCEDCGEIAIVGKQEYGKLVRAPAIYSTELYQVMSDKTLKTLGVWEDDEENATNSEDTGKKAKTSAKKVDVDFVLCKSCGAMVTADEVHNAWCSCGNTSSAKIRRLLTKGDENSRKCLCCNATFRSFRVGFEAATSVLATSLYEQIPEYTYAFEEIPTDKPPSKSIFGANKVNTKRKEKTGSQFLIFSDSRQGAAKFACYLSDAYKEFLRRRGIWSVANEEAIRFARGITASDFVGVLDNFYSSHKLFRSSNADTAQSSIIENRRNAWIAVLNELYNCNRDTSLVSLGKLQFVYAGNTDDIVNAVVENYKIAKPDAQNFLNYLAFEIVRAGAIATDKPTDINDEDRKYIFFTQAQCLVTKNKDKSVAHSQPFLPSRRQLKNGANAFYKSHKLDVTKQVLNVDDNDAVEFLEQYWDYLVSEDNPHRLQTKDGKGFYAQASSFIVFFGNHATLWQCDQCKKVSQFGIANKCIRTNCSGRITRLDSEDFCRNNYYAQIYESQKTQPLFVKEHTAQLAKKEALNYQQMFVRKEINALSSSTTFEMGVDVGDLETVFLRNFPPLASNYAQRVGRAGRSIHAAAFALTFARLSSHDFTYFDRPKDMINGIIFPPMFKLENTKIIKRHIYAVALSQYLQQHPELYKGNDASAFINDKGYEGFVSWLKTEPTELKELLKKSLPNDLWHLQSIEIETFGWLNDFYGTKGRFTTHIAEYEGNVTYLTKERDKALKAKDTAVASIFDRKLKHYQKNDLIDFLVRGNLLPKYGFPVDSVELSQNLSSFDFKSLNLNRDLAIAIAEYAPSAEVVADGKLYTSRYIRKPIVNKTEMRSFETSHFATCANCEHINYSKMPVSEEGRPCVICGSKLHLRDFSQSIEPRAGFIAESDVREVPMRSQERKYKTEAIYIGDKTALPIDTFDYPFGKSSVSVESTTNDSLVVKSTHAFYVCSKCGYSIAGDETSKLKLYEDYKHGVTKLEKTSGSHENPFGRGKCENTVLYRYWLHHEFKTDVAKLSFKTDTTDYETMLSVMYAILNAFATTLSIEQRDISACLSNGSQSDGYERKIILYDAVPGGAGHSRRLVTQDGAVLRQVLANAKQRLETCQCEPSCYRCLRTYDNQRIHEKLDRQKSLNFLLALGFI